MSPLHQSFADTVAPTLPSSKSIPRKTPLTPIFTWASPLGSRLMPCSQALHAFDSGFALILYRYGVYGPTNISRYPPYASGIYDIHIYPSIYIYIYIYIYVYIHAYIMYIYIYMSHRWCPGLQFFMSFDLRTALGLQLSRRYF